MASLAVDQVNAEDFPNYDISLFDLQNTPNGLQIANHRLVADSSQYDNQPHFSPNGEWIYFTHMEDQAAHLWRWSVKSETSQLMLESNLSEYSPTPVPFKPGWISTVRVESDGTQRLWAFEWLENTAQTKSQLWFEAIQPVGYHAWSNQDLALFVLGEPHLLKVTRWGQESSQLIDRNIGRCLQKIPGKNQISYTRLVDKSHQLTRYDFDRKQIEAIGLLPDSAEDYAWLGSDQVISSDGSHLLVAQISPLKENSALVWKKLTNSSKLNLSGISRLAISPDQKLIALVHVTD